MDSAVAPAAPSAAPRSACADSPAPEDPSACALRGAAGLITWGRILDPSLPFIAAILLKTKPRARQGTLPIPLLCLGRCWCSGEPGSMSRGWRALCCSPKRTLARRVQLDDAGGSCTLCGTSPCVTVAPARTRAHSGCATPCGAEPRCSLLPAPGCRAGPSPPGAGAQDAAG